MSYDWEDLYINCFADPVVIDKRTGKPHSRKRRIWARFYNRGGIRVTPPKWKQQLSHTKRRKHDNPL